MIEVESEIAKLLAERGALARALERIAEYPRNRAAELSCTGCRAIARAALAQIEKGRSDLEKDAARGRLLIALGEWRRYQDADESHASLCLRFPYEADLSSKAMRESAIDALVAFERAHGIV